jgi:autotransporter-associated beta strand protein
MPLPNPAPREDTIHALCRRLRAAALTLALAGGMVLATEPARAACTPTSTPTTGQTVTCNVNPPNPATTPIAAQAGATNVTVIMQGGAQINTSGATAITLGGGGQITNNSGAIIQGATGINDTGPLTITNNSTITGTSGPAIILNGPGNSTINNMGTIGGNGSSVIQLNSVAGSTLTLNNTGNGSVNGNVSGSGDGGITIIDAGNFNGNIAINGSGINSVTTAPGHNLGSVSLTGAQNAVVDGGSFNNGLVLNATVSNNVTVQSGAFVNQVFTVSGPANTVDNSGTLNNGLTVSGSGTNQITNEAGGTINSVFNVTGSAADTITNAGTINTVANISGSGTFLDSGRISGSGGTAINFTGSPGPFTLTLTPTYSINGTVNGTGDDTLQLGGTGTGTFNVNNIGPTQQYRGFVIFNKVDASTWTLTGTGTQDWNISAGTLIGDTNSLGGSPITDNSALVFNQSFAGTHAGTIVGSGTVTIQGGGAVTYTADNTYSGPTTVAAGSTLQFGNGGTTGGVAGDIVNNGTIVVDRADILTYAGTISGAGVFNQIGTGSITLTGNSSTFTGAATVSAGMVTVDGTFGAAASTVAVNSGGTLLGVGTIGSAVTLNSGGTLVGAQGTTLTTGPLTLNSGSNINVSLGTPGTAPPLFNVNGALTLGGTLNINDVGGFGTGVYQLFSYSGALTNNGLAFGTLPPGVSASELMVQTSVANQVNLVANLSPGPTPVFRFWDGPNGHGNGAIDGGSGTWNTTNQNWTTADGTTNGHWSTDFAIFTGTPGTVTVDNSAGAISANGMQFAVNGYHLNGDVLTLAGITPLIRVGNGARSSSAFVATIDNVLAGTGTLTKSDFGTLVLTGTNTYSGGTDIASGTLSVSSDANLGAATGDLTFESGTLLTTASFATNRAVTITQSGFFENAAGTTLTVAGPITGTGGLTEVGPGTLVLAQDTSYLAGTDITGGTLQFGNGGTSGSVIGDVTNGGVLVINRSDQFTFDGVISGPGSLVQAGTGVTILTAGGPYTGSTTVASGTLIIRGVLSSTSTVSVGDGGAATLIVENGGEIDSASGVIGNLAGTTGTAIVSGANSIWNPSGTITIGNAGSGTLTISNGGAVNAGVVVIAAQAGSTGTLNIGAPAGMAATAAGALDPPSITFGAGTGTLNFNHTNGSLLFDGVLVGTGTVQQNGPGTTILVGNSPGFTGTTIVNAGTLTVNGTLGSAASTLAVNSGGTLTGAGTVGSAFTVASGGTLAGVDGRVLSTGPLTLNSGSNINVALGIPSTTGLFNVSGPLTLAGTLNVFNIGGFSEGTYRIIDYSGALTNNGLAIGTLPAGEPASDVSVQTSIPQEVNLIVAAPPIPPIPPNPTPVLQFWDGANTRATNTISGGSGTWDVVTQNWTNASGNTNGSWVADFAIFTAAPGAVTVDNSRGAVTASGMQFAVDGYQLTGGTLTLEGAMPVIRVGDGTTAGAGYTATIANVLAGPGELVKTDLGTLVLTGANTYSGGTLIHDGTISISSDANLGAAATQLSFQTGTLATTASIATSRPLTTIQSATLSIAAGTTLELDGTFGGAGSVTKDGAGTLILAGTASHTGGTTIAAGTLQLGNGGATGTLAGNVIDNGAFVIDRSGVFTFAGNISGAGSFTQAGPGTTILTGTNTYAGGTTIAAGSTLQVGTGGATGSIGPGGSFVNNGTLIADRSDNFTFTGTITGTGSVEQRGTGTITVTGNESFTGGLTVSAGTVIIGDGNTAGSITGNVVDNATIAVNREDNIVYAGTISGNGVAKQIGSGTATLTGDSSTFTGSTAVDAGTLAVNGRLGAPTSTLAVNDGGILAGTGVVGGSVTDNPGGTLSPANTTLGTLTVNGNLTFASDSLYRVDLTPAATDLVAVGGQAKLAGEVQVFIAPGNYAPNVRYPIVSASGGVIGTFDTLDPPSSSIFFEPTLAYDANHAYLVITDATFMSVAVTRNQMAVANAVTTLPVTSPVFSALFSLGSDEEARQAFDALSGEIYASTAGALMQESRYVREAVLARLRGGYDMDADALVPSASDPPPGIWVQGLGALASADADGNAGKLHRDSAGAIAGYDLDAFDVLRAGLAGAYVHSALDVDARLSHAYVDSFDIALYGAAKFDELNLRAGAAYAWQNVTARRTVDFTGYMERDGAHYRAPEVQAFGEAGYDITMLPPVLVEPFANVAYVSINTHAFAESGAGAALITRGQSLQTTYTTVGFHGSVSLGSVFDTAMTGTGTLGEQHAFGDATPFATLAFAGGGLPFTIAGAPLARNSAVIESALNFAVLPNANFSFGYSGEIAGRVRDNAIRATLDWSF